MNYLDDIISYFKYLCTQHVLLLHSDNVGSRVFEVRDLDAAFGALRTGVKEKDFLVRFILPTISLRRYDTHVEVEISDNGIGFDAAQVRPSTHGLAGMRHRVEAAGGRLSVQSAPGKGTRILAMMPSAQH